MIEWIAIGVAFLSATGYVYMAVRAENQRKEYEQAAQDAVEAVQGWRDAYLKVYMMNKQKRDKPVVVETLEPRKYTQSDPHILRAKAQTQRVLNAHKYAKQLMNVVNKHAEDGDLSFYVDLNWLPRSSNATLDGLKDISEYGDEIASIISSKGINVTYEEQPGNIFSSGYQRLVFEL